MFSALWFLVKTLPIVYYIFPFMGPVSMAVYTGIVVWKFI